MNDYEETLLNKQSDIDYEETVKQQSDETSEFPTTRVTPNISRAGR